MRSRDEVDFNFDFDMLDFLESTANVFLLCREEDLDSCKLPCTLPIASRLASSLRFELVFAFDATVLLELSAVTAVRFDREDDDGFVLEEDGVSVSLSDRVLRFCVEELKSSFLSSRPSPLVLSFDDPLVLEEARDFVSEADIVLLLALERRFDEATVPEEARNSASTSDIVLRLDLETFDLSLLSTAEDLASSS